MEINELTYLIRGAAFRVHSKLGPRLLESIYQKALVIELNSVGLFTESEKSINVEYNGIDLGLGFRMDILVNNKIILELKSVSKVDNSHHKQLQTYLKVSNKPCGLLINFHELNLQDGIFRHMN